MRIFVVAKFTGADNKERLEKIREILKELGHEVFVGPIDIDNYGADPVPSDEFMKRAFEEIQKCDMVLIKHTEPGTGIGIEAGYGEANGKRIVIIYPTHTKKKSNSLEGIAEKTIEYDTFDELKEKLKDL